MLENPILICCELLVVANSVTLETTGMHETAFTKFNLYNRLEV